MDDTDEKDPRARWRVLPAPVDPTGTTARATHVPADFDIRTQFDPQTEVVRTFW